MDILHKPPALARVCESVIALEGNLAVCRMCMHLSLGADHGYDLKGSNGCDGWVYLLRL